jgi:hypothetical protein
MRINDQKINNYNINNKGSQMGILLEMNNFKYIHNNHNACILAYSYSSSNLYYQGVFCFHPTKDGDKGRSGMAAAVRRNCS